MQITLDRNHHLPLYGSDCTCCIHRLSLKTCAAFPGGIPDVIWNGDFDHTQPYPTAEAPEDLGIRYAPDMDS